MSRLDDFVNHFRHGAAPEEREILVQKAERHEEIIAKADAVLAVAEKKLGRTGAYGQAPSGWRR